MLVLDPYATWYLYDLTLRCGSVIAGAKIPSSRGKKFGYDIKSGVPTNAADEYSKFREEKYRLVERYKFFARLDIQNCFNNIYHHDIVRFVAQRVPSEEQHFGQFLRENNGGRSTYCIPQGIFPGKLLGNSFLEFIENSAQLVSEAVIRFMDDVFLFSNFRWKLERDSLTIQRMLGDRSLAINHEKTWFGRSTTEFQERQIDDVKIDLLQKRENAIAETYDEPPNPIELTAEERSYLEKLVGNSDAAEEDVELALSLLLDSTGSDVSSHLAAIVFRKYPNLLKSMHRYLDGANVDYEQFLSLIDERTSSRTVHEFELFWFARILRDHFYYLGEDVALRLIQIYEHPRASAVVKAVVLEEQRNEYGLQDVKEAKISSPSSIIESVAAAVGLLRTPKGRRNQLYKYAASMGAHVGAIVTELGHTDPNSPGDSVPES